MDFNEHFHESEMLKIYDGESNFICDWVPAVRAMMNMCKDKSSGFFVADNSICSNFVQILKKVIPVYFVWLPNESDEGISDLHTTYPVIQNRFIDDGIFPVTCLMWKRKEKGFYAIESKYFEPIRSQEIFVTIFTNHKKMSIQLINLNELDMCFMQIHEINAQTACDRHPSDGLAKYSENELFLPGLVYREVGFRT